MKRRLKHPDEDELAFEYQRRSDEWAERMNDKELSDQERDEAQEQAQYWFNRAVERKAEAKRLKAEAERATLDANTGLAGYLRAFSFPRYD